MKLSKVIICQKSKKSKVIISFYPMKCIKTVIVAAFFIYYKAIFPFILSARTDIKHRVDEYSIPQFLRSAPYTIVPNCHPKPIIQEKIFKRNNYDF